MNAQTLLGKPGIAFLLLTAACTSSSGDTKLDAGGDGTSDAASPDAAVVVTLGGTVERGEYLVDHVLMCGVCHTPSLPNGDPDPTKYLAGSRSYDFTDLDGTIVTVNAENLTSHDPEGL